MCTPLIKEVKSLSRFSQQARFPITWNIYSFSVMALVIKCRILWQFLHFSGRCVWGPCACLLVSVLFSSLYFQLRSFFPSPFDPFYLLKLCLFLLLLLNLCTQHCSTGEKTALSSHTVPSSNLCDVQSEVTSLLFLSMSRQLANGTKN